MRNFVIWFQHRSGSSHLVSLLNSHPEIHCKGEIFGCVPVGSQLGSKLDSGNTDNRLWRENFYRRIVNQFPGRVDHPSDSRCISELESFFGTAPSVEHQATRIHGFKLKFPSQAALFPGIANWLHDRSGQIGVIALYRRNYLRRALSVLNLDRIRQASDRANIRHTLDLPAARFDVQEVIRLIEYYADMEQEFTAWADAFKNRLDIEYQELADDPDTISTKVQNFLGVNGIRPLTSSIKRINPNDLTNFVSNFDELKKALVEEGFEKFL